MGTEVGTSIDQESKEELSFLFKDDRESFNYVSTHPIGATAFIELKQKGYEEKHIPLLLKKILSNYDKIIENDEINQILRIPGSFRNPESLSKLLIGDRVLATAIALTCRGEYQCPTGMREVFKRAGGFPFVHKAGEMIGEPLKYDPEKRLKSLLYKLKNNFGLDNEVIKRCLKTWRDDKVPVTPPYAGGLVYYVSQFTDRPLTQRDVADQLSVSEPPVRNAYRRIYREQRDKLYREEEKISTEFQKFGVDIEINKETLSWEMEKQKVRLKLVEYLLKNNHDENKPIEDEWELCEKLQLTTHGYNVVKDYIEGTLDPVNLGVCERRDDRYFINSKETQKAKTYVQLMKRLVEVGIMYNMRL
jgi:hypothetical protein